MGGMSVKQVAQGFIALLVLIGVVWLAFYALVLVLVLAALATAYYFTRRFLVHKGIVQPSPYEEVMTPSEGSSAHRASPSVQVIDAEYNDVTTPKKDTQA